MPNSGNGNISNNKFKEIDILVIQLFCYELPIKYKAYLTINQPTQTIEAFSCTMNVVKSKKLNQKKKRSFRETVANHYTNYTDDSSI